VSGEARREAIVQAIRNSQKPVSGGNLAKQMQVSRQVIVQDIALLRANGLRIESTNRGYVMREEKCVRRVFKVAHPDEAVEDELNLIVDYGGCVEDVFIAHKVYGVMRGILKVHSRLEVQNYMNEIRSGKSRLLKNVTSGFHYHTVTAESEEILDLIQEALKKKGFLAELQGYEPVKFGRQSDEA
jgi:transcriptional regulator of NAD metabolism